MAVIVSDDFVSGDNAYLSKHNANKAAFKAAIESLQTGAQATIEKGVANGYPGLDADGKVSPAILPDTYQPTSQKGELNGYAPLDGAGKVPLAMTYVDVTGTVDLAPYLLAADAAAAYVPLSSKGVADGVASLDGGGKVPDGQIPAGIARDSEVTAAISDALAGYVPSGDLSGYETAAHAASTYETSAHAASTYAPIAQPVMFPMFVPGKMSDAQLVFAIKPAFAVSFPIALAGTTVRVTANPAATCTVTLKKNGASFATISIATDGAPTLTSAAGASFNGTTDELTVEGQATADTALTNIGIALKGAR